MKHNRRKWATAILATAALASALPITSQGVPLARDLALDGRQAERSCVPLLLEFAADDCDYCTLLEEEILNPTLLDRDYDQRVLMRKLVLDPGIRIIDFTGKQTDATHLASRYKVFVTPTLLFVDRHGAELAERMVGVTTLEFYGGYLDQALDTARERLGKQVECQEHIFEPRPPLS
ncbi:MAG: thioredoxin family protein [Thiogranum sp.]